MELGLFGPCGLSVIERCPYFRGVRFTEVEFVWSLVSFGPCGLSVMERCPYYRGRVCMEFGLFGPCGLSVIERCPYYRGVRRERFDCSCHYS